MVQIENQHWNERPSQGNLCSRFAASLVVSDYTGHEITPAQQRVVAQSLVSAPRSLFVEAVALEIDATSGYMQAAAILEARDPAEALDRLSFSLVGALAALPEVDPECLELAEAHVASEAELLMDHPDSQPILGIMDRDYCTEEVHTLVLDPETQEEVIADPRQIFYDARLDCLLGLEH